MKKKQLTLEQEISARLEPLAHEIAELARLRTIDQLRGAFAKGIGAALDQSSLEVLRGRSKVRAAVGRAKHQARAHSSAGHRVHALKGAKRSPQALEELTQRVIGLLKHKPALNVEQIASALRVSTRDLVLPIAKAMRAGKLQRKGLRRGTRYSVRP